MASNHFDGQASTDYKEAFSLFDKRGNGRVAVDALGDLLRACGQNPTLAEIREQEKVVGGADCESAPQEALDRRGSRGDALFSDQASAKK